jgi:diacylglycerol kinase family enzyme
MEMLVQLLHNPTAGNEEHDKDQLVSLIEAHGFECRYSSTKKKAWEGLDAEADFLAVAGGDGTVRKITKELLASEILGKQWPLALLPLGTANNIAKTLDLEKAPEELVSSWHNSKLKPYDVGLILNMDKTQFFLESFGYGLFPYLMKKMKKHAEIEDPEESMRTSLKLAYELALSYEPRQCGLEIDGVDHSGKYLLVEIMNTKSIGPNLFLSPNADPGDGRLEVVMIPESDKEKFTTYVLNKLNGQEVEYDFAGLDAKRIKICWEGTHVHVDDEVIKIKKGKKIEIEIRESLLQFMVQ